MHVCEALVQILIELKSLDSQSLGMCSDASGTGCRGTDAGLPGTLRPFVLLFRWPRDLPLHVRLFRGNMINKVMDYLVLLSQKMRDLIVRC